MSENVLIQARRALAERLRDALPENVATFDHWPERVDAPCALVAAGDPYLSAEGTVFGSLRVSHEVTLVASAITTNDAATDDLDDLIAAIVAEFAGDLQQVSRPEMLDAGGVRYLSARLTVSDVIRP